MPVARSLVIPRAFIERDYPYALQKRHFESAMQDIYDFFFEVNHLLQNKGWKRLDDLMRPAAMSGIISDMLTASMARHNHTLVENQYFNGHPDLIVQGVYSRNSIQSGEHGVEVKTTVKPGGAVDMHGARNQWLCVFVYDSDQETEPAVNRAPMRFTEVYLAHVTTADFRENARTSLGTDTATLHADGLVKLREGCVYKSVRSENGVVTDFQINRERNEPEILFSLRQGNGTLLPCRVVGKLKERLLAAKGQTVQDGMKASVICDLYLSRKIDQFGTHEIIEGEVTKITEFARIAA